MTEPMRHISKPFPVKPQRRAGDGGGSCMVALPAVVWTIIVVLVRKAFGR